MELMAFSRATTWSGIPVDIDKISVEINSRWQFVGSSGWRVLWQEKDARENSSQTKVGWRSFMKKSPWTAESYSIHEYKLGDDWGGVVTPPISWTAYFVERTHSN